MSRVTGARIAATYLLLEIAGRLLFNHRKSYKPASPYGVFGIVLDGRLLAYHYLQRKDFDKVAQHSP